MSQHSLGEQQRVAFARLLLHRPGLAFLDEATGAVDSETEALLYRALQNQLSSYISIGEIRPGFVLQIEVHQIVSSCLTFGRIFGIPKLELNLGDLVEVGSI